MWRRSLSLFAPPLRIANCSGFFGDALSAAKQQVSNDIHVLCGDYLSELTMAILHSLRAKDPQQGYVPTFLFQLKQVLRQCKENNIRVVSNAGGLNPSGLAVEIQNLAQKLGVNVKVACVTGDDILPRIKAKDPALGHLSNLETGERLECCPMALATANVYNGGWAIADALREGADIVVTGRVADAALVMGPAAWKHNWKRDYYNQLSGALVAGHIIECGAHCTGGNYSGWRSLNTDLTHNVGFPIAEIDEHGNTIITKSRDTNGCVTVSTVTSQLMYEIQGPHYYSPDVIADFRTIKLEQLDIDRVAVTGTKGIGIPDDLKVCINHFGGYRNTLTFVLVGLDIPQKALLIENAVWAVLGGREAFDSVDVKLLNANNSAETWEDSMAFLKITIKDKDKTKVSRKQVAKVIELALSNYPGFVMSPSTPTDPTPFAVYWPTTVNRKEIEETIHFSTTQEQNSILPRTVPSFHPDCKYVTELTTTPDVTPKSTPNPTTSDEDMMRPLGDVFGARSGDKGSSCNLGIWAYSDDAFKWLEANMSVEELKRLLPECRDLRVERHSFPNLMAVNFVVHRLLAPGAASNCLIDPWAKSFGEYWRAKRAPIPLHIKK